MSAFVVLAALLLTAGGILLLLRQLWGIVSVMIVWVVLVMMA